MFFCYSSGYKSVIARVFRPYIFTTTQSLYFRLLLSSSTGLLSFIIIFYTTKYGNPNSVGLIDHCIRPCPWGLLNSILITMWSLRLSGYTYYNNLILIDCQSILRGIFMYLFSGISIIFLFLVNNIGYLLISLFSIRASLTVLYN